MGSTNAPQGSTDPPWLSLVRERGFALIPGVLAGEELRALRAAVENLNAGEGLRVRAGAPFAARNALTLLPEARAVVRGALTGLARAVLGPDARPVKATLFDKTPAANWNVGWHQDVTIAVQEQRPAPGFGAWSVKAGVPHCQPPAEVLARMLALRLHLDDCPDENGALRVIPRSHASGKLDAAGLREWLARPAAACPAAAGDVLLMRPLLLHASAPATRPGHRRVLHVEFAAEPLPHPLDWPRDLEGPCSAAGERRRR
jgi:hypothetical protein